MDMAFEQEVREVVHKVIAEVFFDGDPNVLLALKGYQPKASGKLEGQHPPTTDSSIQS
jgi:hypothetical protein